MLPYITTSNLYWGQFDLSSVRQMYFKDSEIEKCSVSNGDLLVCEGGDIGRAAIWPYDTPMCIQNHIHKLRSYNQLDTLFYYYIFQAYKYNGYIGGKGIGIQGLSSKALHNMLVPLPPINEQIRITSKLVLYFSSSNKRTILSLILLCSSLGGRGNNVFNNVSLEMPGIILLACLSIDDILA